MLTPPVSSRDHVLGPPNAPVVMVEYGNFECPACAEAEPVFRALRETLSDSLLFAYRHFPRLSGVEQRAARRSCRGTEFRQGQPGVNLNPYAVVFQQAATQLLGSGSRLVNVPF